MNREEVDLSPWSAYRATSSRARWTLRGRYAPREFQSALADFTSAVASQCCQSCRPSYGTRWISASRSFAGEAEARLEELLRAADRGKLEPLYNFMNDLPSLEGEPAPYLPVDVVRRTMGVRTSFDAGRGCPFLCSFCTIINVQGRKSRARSPDDIERLVRANVAQGVHKFFITDDNLARNQTWEAIFDRLIKMREQEGLAIRIIAQVDTMAHKIRGFIEKAARAGVDRRIHRLGEHQSGVPEGCAEEPEPHH